MIIEAKKVGDLSEALEKPYDIVGVDEVHMFDEKEADVIEELLKRGTKVVVSGLYADYRGKMYDIVRRLFELGPKQVTFKRAACEVCKKPDAVFTQILDENGPILGGLPPSIPEDGTYTYKPVCRHCFVKE